MRGRRNETSTPIACDLGNKKENLGRFISELLTGSPRKLGLGSQVSLRRKLEGQGGVGGNLMFKTPSIATQIDFAWGNSSL